MEVPSGDAIAAVVLTEFEKWPPKRKPQARGEGIREWVPISGIVAQGRGHLVCLAAATGMKCLPQNKISQAQGVVIHDWHAEVLAIRSLNRFLLEECLALALSKRQTSDYVRFRSEDERTAKHFQPFALHDEIRLHMYCSEAPCGDASMELTMAAQQDDTPWDLPPIIQASSSSKVPPDAPVLHGRGYFSALGLVRRKPSRPDAPPTLSKSCSDKLALKQSTSLLSSLTSLIISPQLCYIQTLTLPASQFCSTACARAFSDSGRLAPLVGNDEGWHGGYSFKPFQVLSTAKEFSYSRRQKSEKLIASNIAASWTPNYSETLIGGTMQGKKQFSTRGASRACQRRNWRLALEIASMLSVPAIEKALRAGTYREVKEGQLLEERRRVKSAVKGAEGPLKGWVKNLGGEDWSVDSVEI